MRQQHQVHISVLDTAPITQRSNARKALCNSVELAQLVDDLGYHRYWVPEHYGMSGVASAAPAVVVERVHRKYATRPLLRPLAERWLSTAAGGRHRIRHRDLPALSRSG